MNTKLIKSEIEKLARIASSWDDAQEVDAIERDLALDKTKHIYELLRFGEEVAVTSSEESVTDTIMTAIANTPEIGDEKDVEVEFMFAEDDEIEQTDEQLTIEISEQSDDNDVEVEFLFADDDQDDEPEEHLSIVEPTAAEPSDEDKEQITHKIISEPEPIIAQQPIQEPEPTPESEPKPEPKPEPQPIVEQVAPEVEAPKNVKPSSGNLFGIEEVRRPRSSKHQRMMSIYNDAATEKSHEKKVDISKIFDFGLDAESSTPKFESERGFTPSTTPLAESIDKSIILGDIISPNAPTLADTISTPAPLAEEITHSKISSLSQGVGINDKFLMIRDLFDGDDEAYSQTISELDAMESFDDCIIYIAENFEWNPDSEGAKFIMQLLERKHS